MAEQAKIDKLRKLREQFRAQLPDRLDALRVAWASVLTGGDQSAALGEFHRLVHSLAGTAGTFGLPEISARARELENLVLPLADRDTPIEAAEVEAIGHKLEEFALPPSEPQGERRAATPAPVARPEAVGAASRCVFLIEDDRQLADELAAQLKVYGWDVRAFGDATSALRALDTEQPRAVIADAMLPEGKLAGIELIPDAKRHAPDAVFIIASIRWDWESRLAAARAGADAYLTKPIDFNILTDRLDHLTNRGTEDAYRVLIIDDEPLLAEHYAQTLNAASMHAMAITKPSRLPESLNELQPELVLTDLYMPECTGIEAARVIRQDERYAGTPIVFLSAESGRQQQLSALGTGADDFLTKPISDADLVAAVGLRIARFRALTRLIRQDGLTGLLNRIAFDLQAEAEIERTRRSGTPLILAMLDIDHFKKINDTHGHPVGDRVIKSLAQLLRKRLRKYDVIGRYGGEEFAVLMPNTSLKAADEIMDALREQFASLRQSTADAGFNSTFSAGIAGLGEGMDKSALIATADEALYEAKRLGRNRVCRARPGMEAA